VLEKGFEEKVCPVVSGDNHLSSLIFKWRKLSAAGFGFNFTENGLKSL